MRGRQEFKGLSLWGFDADDLGAAGSFDFHDEGFMGLVLAELFVSLFEFVDVGDRLAIELKDEVFAFEVGGLGGRAWADDCDEDAGGFVVEFKLVAVLKGQVADGEAKILGIEAFGAGGASRLLSHGELDVVERLPFAGGDGERDGLPGFEPDELVSEDAWEFVGVVAAFERFAVDFDDDVAALEASFGGGSIGDDVADLDGGLVFQSKKFGDIFFKTGQLHDADPRKFLWLPGDGEVGEAANKFLGRHEEEGRILNGGEGLARIIEERDLFIVDNANRLAGGIEDGGTESAEAAVGDEDHVDFAAEFGGDGTFHEVGAVAGAFREDADGVNGLADVDGGIFKFDRFPVAFIFDFDKPEAGTFIAPEESGVEFFVIGISAWDDNFEILHLCVWNGGIENA